ncbi:hypothetical protein SSCG_01575 [Streptomyces clavuligerus]|nr:hypothetical protein SSCG_01575 [Streptomyces clavuligerus]
MAPVRPAWTTTPERGPKDGPAAGARANEDPKGSGGSTRPGGTARSGRAAGLGGAASGGAPRGP